MIMILCGYSKWQDRLSTRAHVSWWIMSWRENMITKDKAKEIARLEVCCCTDRLPPDDELIIVDEATIERPWGWVFFYTSKKWKETGDIHYAIAGNAPVIIERSTGKLIDTGTAREIDYYIENYERTGDPHG